MSMAALATTDTAIGRLDRSWLVRCAPLGGIAFVVLWGVAFGAFLVQEPATSDAGVVAHYTNPETQGRSQTATFLIVLAGLCFLWFLTGLRARLARAEGLAGVYTTLAFGAGLVSSALWIVVGVFWMAVGYTAQETPEYTVDPDTARLIAEIGYLTWVFGTVVALLLVLATSLLGLRTGVVPRWLAWVGLLVAVAMFVTALFVGFFVFLAWVLAVSVALIVRRDRFAELAPVET
jgi:hypothetical protein